jgi:GR25 family glycosyltransferase involved in LPS biosynthesis
MRIIVINRADRTDRLIQVTEELSEQGLTYTPFNAIIDKIGWVGCRDSHVVVLKKYKEEGTFLILEDDVQFLYPFYSYLALAIAELPVDWDCLYLGGSPQEPQKRYSDNLFRCKNTLTTHAILWNYPGSGAIDYILSHTTAIRKFDVYMQEIIQELFNCYMIYPMLITQRESKSDIARRSDVSTIARNSNLYCK